MEKLLKQDMDSSKEQVSQLQIQEVNVQTIEDPIEQNNAITNILNEWNFIRDNRSDHSHFAKRILLSIILLYCKNAKLLSYALKMKVFDRMPRGYVTDLNLAGKETLNLKLKARLDHLFHTTKRYEEECVLLNKNLTRIKHENDTLHLQINESDKQWQEMNCILSHIQAKSEIAVNKQNKLLALLISAREQNQKMEIIKHNLKCMKQELITEKIEKKKILQELSTAKAKYESLLHLIYANTVKRKNGVLSKIKNVLNVCYSEIDIFPFMANELFNWFCTFIL